MTSPGAARPRFLLPARPVLIDWLWAGASAGLIFGLSELAVAVPLGAALDPRLAALVLGIDCLVVAVGSFLVGAILRAASVRMSRSGLVGAVVGPLLFAAIASRFWSELSTGDLPDLLDFAGLMTAAMLAAAAGLTASRLADALERRGIVCSALFVWGAVSVPLAASERLSRTQWMQGSTAVVVSLGLMLAVVAAVWAGIAVARRREGRAGRPFGWTMLGLATIASGAAAAPVLLPWILYDREAPEVALGPPNFLIAVLPDPNDEDPSRAHSFEPMTPTLDRLAFEGTTYVIRPEYPQTAIGALLTDTRHLDVVAQLDADGYATAAILSGGSAPPELAAAEVDARPGTRALLEGPLAWLGATPLLMGSAFPLLRGLGLDTETRGADRLAERAKAWLLDWRSERSGAPFFLFIDFRNVAPPRDGESPLQRSDARLGDILEHLLVLGVEESTLVAVLRESGSQGAPSTRNWQVVVQAPARWPRNARSAHMGPTRSGQLGDFLLEVGRSDGRSPVALPASSQAP